SRTLMVWRGIKTPRGYKTNKLFRFFQPRPMAALTNPLLAFDVHELHRPSDVRLADKWITETPNQVHTMGHCREDLGVVDAPRADHPPRDRHTPGPAESVH